MKRVIFALGILLSLNSNAQQVVGKIKTFDFNIHLPIKTTMGVADEIMSSPTLPFYKVGNTEHFLNSPLFDIHLDTVKLPLLHFINKNNQWVLENYYNQGGMIAFNYATSLDSLGTLALISGGDGGVGIDAGSDLIISKTNGDSLSFRKITSTTPGNRLWYIKSADINGDNLIDLLTFGGQYPNNTLMPYLQNNSGNFIYDSTLIPGKGMVANVDPIAFSVPNTGTTLGIAKLFDSNSKYPIIIKGQYSTSKAARYGLAFYNFNPLTSRYDSFSILKDLGVFSDTTVGTSDLSIADLNNDGLLDLAVHYETQSGTGLQIFLNDGHQNFIAGQLWKNDGSDSTFGNAFNFGDINLYDINGDGFKDIILAPIGGGPQTKEYNFYYPCVGNNCGSFASGFHLENFILLNDGNGHFSPLKTQIGFKDVVPYFLKAMPINNQIRYVGFTYPNIAGNPNPSAPDSIRLVDVTVTFCNKLVKPIFSSNKFSFCSGDSIKLSITNVNKGDSLKWYYGTKSDITNTSSKSFIDSTTLFVTRTDSLGCISSSDTVKIIKTNCNTIKLPTSYELHNSRQWLNIPNGYASFAQFDYNKDGYEDVLLFQGYDISVPYTWPGPYFYKNNGTSLVTDSALTINYKHIFSVATLNGDYNNDGNTDAILLTGMDPAGCIGKPGCIEPLVPIYILTNKNGKSFTVDSLNYPGVWEAGSTADINGDGYLDLVAFSLHHEYASGLINRTFINDGKGNFTARKSQIDNIAWVDRSELIDMNNDGYPDLLINDVPPGPTYSNRFRILWNDKDGNFNENNSSTISIPNSSYLLGIRAQDIDGDGIKEIFLPMNDTSNTWKVLIYKSKDGKNYADSSSKLIINNTNKMPPFIGNNPLVISDIDGNGKLDLFIKDKTFGIRWEWNGTSFIRNNCNNFTKPAFNTSKFSFCSGDSLKLTISNVNKGDTLKWFYGTKSDLTNVTNKTFTDSTKLFVTRTDSLGCVISSDTVSLVKFSIPSAPLLSRDTANNLVASINGITWYKDGTVITDTTQKIKPTIGGSYTAKTTQNGCISALSTPYYYLVTDIINLSAEEYIKLAPNPFSNQLNFDFVVKGYQRLNMEVFDLASGARVAIKQNLTPGIPIYLGQLSAGTYVIKITSNDLKVSYQFKMVKL